MADDVRARKRLNSNTSILSLLWLHKSFHTDKHSYIRAVIWCTHSSQYSVWKDSHQLQMLYLFNMSWQWPEKVLLRRCPVYTAFMWGRGEFSLQYENSFTWVMSKHWSLVHRFKKYISMWRKHLSLWFPGGFKVSILQVCRPQLMKHEHLSLLLSSLCFRSLPNPLSLYSWNGALPERLLLWFFI